MIRGTLSSFAASAALLTAAILPLSTVARHAVLDQVLSDKPPPEETDASCVQWVRAGLNEGVDSKGAPLVEPEVHHLIKAMRLTWWECASEIANTLAKYGPEVEDAFQLEQRTITKNLNQIKSALQKGKPTKSISPAFEWAQSRDWVYINAKMSHKIDAPATLNVVSEGVEIRTKSLKFAASKDHKRFALDLTLQADIDPEPSTISFGSVGRVTFTLKKAQGGVKWPKLLHDSQQKPVNMHVWWAKQDEYADDLDELEDQERNADSTLTAEEGGRNESASKDAGSQGGETMTTAAENNPALTVEERLERAKKEAASALSKEKKSRMEELEREKRATVKIIDEDSAAKKKEAENALRAKKAVVEEEFSKLASERLAEVEAAHTNAQSEL